MLQKSFGVPGSCCLCHCRRGVEQQGRWGAVATEDLGPVVLVETVVVLAKRVEEAGELASELLDVAVAAVAAVHD